MFLIIKFSNKSTENSFDSSVARGKSDWWSRNNTNYYTVFSILQTLRSLVAMNENLKKQEQEFKAHCKEEMARLKANIEKLKSETDSEVSEDKVSLFLWSLVLYPIKVG